MFTCAYEIGGGGGARYYKMPLKYQHALLPEIPSMDMNQ